MRLSVLLLAGAVALLAAIVPLVSATHFAFGTVSWTLNTGTTKTFTYVIEQAYRRTYFSPLPAAGPPPNGPFNVGGFYWRNPSGSQERSATIYLSPKQIYSSDDYWTGTWTASFTPALNSGRYSHYFTMCCRISTIADSNRDRDATLLSYQDITEPYSPRTTALPRFYFQRAAPAYFKVPGTSPQQYTLTFAVPPGSESSLSVLNPGGTVPFSLNTVTGVCTWTPNVAGLFAWQVRVSDGKSQVPLDILFQVLAQCTTGQCAQPPTFIPATPQDQVFYRGVQRSFTLQATNVDASTTTTIQSSVLPNGGTFTRLSSLGPLCTYQLTWQPSLSDSSWTMCFAAQSSNGLSSLGNYCLQLNIGTASLIYVSGIVRDFSKGVNPGVSTQWLFNNPIQNQDDGAGNQFVSSTLAATGKPVFSGGTRGSGLSATIFNQWWQTDAAGVINKEVVLSTTLSNGTNSDSRVFTFLSSSFWPIDNLGFGNELDTHNRFFTYEIHTYLTYKGGEIFNLQSSDDLWVFVNNKLPTNWPMNGIHPFAQQGFALNMDSQASNFGITRDNTYRLDIFYACRSQLHDCGFKLELPAAILCDAIQSGTTAINVTGAFTAAEITTLGQAAVTSGNIRIIPATAASDSGSAWFPGTDGPGPQRLKLLHGFSTQFDFRTSGCVTSAPPEGFAFVVQAASVGARGGEAGNLGYGTIRNSLAVEFDMNYNSEFADPVDSCVGGTGQGYQHVSFHTGRTLPNSASETYSIGASLCPGTSKLTLTMHNSSWHRVKITFTPAKDDPSGGPQLGWVRVFMSIVDNAGAVISTVIAPIAEAQVDGVVLQQMWAGGAAYAGFTASSQDTNRCNIDIRKWSMVVVPPSASLTTTTGTLATIRAGTTGVAQVQAKDSCGNLIKTGGDLSLFDSSFRPRLGYSSVATIFPTIADLATGIYTFSYTPTKTGVMRLAVTMDGSPILNSPFQVLVNAGPTVPSASVFIYSPDIAMTESNSLLQSALFVVAAEPTYGDIKFKQAFAMSAGTAPAALQAFIASIPNGHVVAVAFAGTVVTTAWAVGSVTQLALGLVGASQAYQVAPGGSYCSVGVKAATAFASSTQTRFNDQPTDILKVAYTGSGQNFKVWCQSAGADWGNYGQILVVPDIVHVPAGASTNIYIEARDAYNNLNTDGGDNFALSFQPDINQLGGANVVNALTAAYDGHYVVNFVCTLAGKLAMYVKLDGTQIGASGAAVDVFIDADIAVASRSSASGTGLVQATAGSAATFTLQLYDQYGNQVTSLNRRDVILAPTITSTSTPANTYTATCSWVGSSSPQVYTCTYTPLKTGTDYKLSVNINGAVMPSAATIIVVAGVPVVSRATAIGAGISVGTSVVAGTEVSWWIQSYDANDNLVLVASPTGASYVYTVAYGAGTGAVSAITGLTPQHDGLGKYLSKYMPTTRSSTGTITISAYMGGVSNPIGRPTPQPMTVTVLPGAVGPKSVLSRVVYSMVAGQTFTAQVESKDAYDNARSVGPFTDGSAFAVRFKTTGSIDVRGTTAFLTATNQNYPLTYTTTVSGQYQLDVKVAATSIDIVYPGADAPLIMVHPGPTVSLKCTATGPGTISGQQATTATFTIQAADQYGNAQNNTNDLFVLTNAGAALPAYSVVAATNGGLTPGQFLATYTVPSVTGSFPLRITRTVGSTNEPVATFTVAVFLNPQVSYARLQVPSGQTTLTARAGVQLDFTIKNRNQANTADQAAGEAGWYFTMLVTKDGTTNTAALATVPANTITINPGAALSTAGQITWTGSLTPGAGTVGTWTPVLYLKGGFKVDVPQPTIVITAGPATSATAVVAGLPNLSATAGVTYPFTVQLRDQFNNIVSTGTDTVSYLLSSVTTSCSWVSATSLYNCAYTVTRPIGSLQVQVRLNGADVIGTYNLQVGPAPPSAATTTAAGLGLTTTTAGVAATFRVTVLDAYGNLALTDSSSGGAPTPTVTLATSVFNGATPVTLTSSVTRYLSGSVYEIEYVVQTASVVGTPFTHRVTLGGTAISGSPFSLNVAPGPVSGAQSTLSGSTTQVVAGQPIVLTLVARDLYSNPIRNDASAIRARATAPTTTTATTTDATVTTTTPAAPGTFTITFAGINTQRMGLYPFLFSSAGSDFEPSGSTTTVTVIAGPTDPDQTIVPLSMPAGYAGQVATIQITLADKYQNKRAPPVAETIVVDFDAGKADCIYDTEFGVRVDAGIHKNRFPSASSLFTQRAVTNYAAATGVYTISYTTETVGAYSMNLTIGGVVMGCAKQSQLTFNVAPGPVSNLRSVYSAPQPGVAGVGQEITIQLRDQYGNNLDRDRTGDSTNGVRLELGAVASSAYPIETVTNPWFGKGKPIVIGTAELYEAQFSTAWSSQGPNLTYVADGLYRFNINTTTAASYAFLLAVNLGTGGGLISGQQNLTIIPSPPARFQTPTFPTDTRAAVPASFVLQGTDVLGNPIDTDLHTYSVLFNRVGSPSYKFSGTPVSLGGRTGRHRVDFRSSWHGEYEVTIVLIVNGQEVLASSQTVRPYNILTATCAGTDPTKPYRCPNGECKTAYADCPDITPTCTGATPVLCASGACAATALACACPGSIARCPDGHCPATADDCLPVNDCDGTLCPGSGVCRASLADCPTQLVCPPGQGICPSNVACAASLALCDVAIYASTCPSGQTHCADGNCAADIDDCATGKTCATGQVLCPDGSCQLSAAACPSTYKCYDPAPFRCPNGECRVSSEQCPNLVVCSAGSVLCPSGTCATSLAACTSLPTCALSQVRCPDGSCAINLDFCATTPTCTDAKPVHCSDGSCQVSSFLCPAPRVCPTGYSVCTDGTCVTASQTCPTQPTCPVETPGLCNDGTCVADMSLCTTVPSCPIARPLRCPDGSCRGSFDDCPSQSACPSTLPVRCPDGSCSVAIGSCLPIVACNGTIRCPGGECAASLQLCPTHVTCPVGSAKCLDGTCRSVCPSSGLFACEGTNVTCPQAGFGVQCAASISQCPQAPVCPANKPVKCIDVTCAASVDLCPPLPTSFPDNKVACADWTWQSSIKECGTAVTCPLTAPYKCYDDTCRASPVDCPSPPSCSGDTPYLCPNGVCAQYLWSPNCGSSGTPCDQVATPVKCPNGECKVSTDQCEQAATIAESTQCPISWSRCRDGSCMPNAQSCADLSCPTILPYLCTDGMCALNRASCNQPNGCPALQPIKCTPGGACVSATNLCPQNVTACPSTRPVACPDGSCGLTVASCANANGCTGTQIMCVDKSCVAAPTADVNRCTDGASVANTCPTTAPYQCLNGFCAQTSLLCPKLVPVTCPSSAPAQCADGSCRAALLQCPVIAPCEGETPARCPDGSCRADADLCPTYSTCPTGYKYRCPNGLCASGPGGCINDVGCPTSASYKCPTGVCVAAESQCSALVPVGNGCNTTTIVKCWDGACVADASECRALNGCPSTTPYRCAVDGACVTRPSQCSTHSACPATSVTCADGSCVTSVTLCRALNGCPITTPYRCGDGSCATNAAACTPVTVCDLDAGEVQCYDGKCVSSYTQCAPATECTAYRCPDLTCVESKSDCPAVAACPVTAPVLCPSGVCKGSSASCPSTSSTGAIGSGGVDLTRPTCSGTKPVECFDGSCKATYADCMSLNAAVLGTTYSATGAVAVCSGSQATCANGACASNQWACPVVKACPTNFWRCADGSCVNSTSSSVGTCTAMGACTSGSVRCEDGSCRTQCLQFDGCPLNLPYHCANRECAANQAGCATADVFDTSFALKSRRRLLSSTGSSSSSTQSSSSGSSSSSSSAVSVPASICYKNCAADTKALYLEYTVDRTQENKFAIAVDGTRSELTTLTISGGSLVKYDASNATASIKFYVHPVGASRLRKTVDKVTLSRRGTFGTYMPYSAAVLSPAFECSVDAYIIQPFPVLIQAQSAIDMTRYPLYTDVCLAFTFYIPAVNFAAWKCVDRTDISRAANPVRTAAANRTDAINVVTGKFATCAVQNGATTGTIYAFVHQPARAPNLGSDAVDTFWADNIIWIVLGFCCFGALMAGVFYAAKRLHRYRMKYKEETAAVGKMQEEVDNMEQFGGQAGTKDEQLEMMSNPMVVQMQQMQARLDAKNAEVIKEEKEEREKASEARQEHIQNLAADREKLAAELDALKAQLALSSPSARSPVAVTVPITGSASASAGARSKPAAARADFDTKPAQRKKKNADDD